MTTAATGPASREQKASRTRPAALSPVLPCVFRDRADNCRRRPTSWSSAPWQVSAASGARCSGSGKANLHGHLHQLCLGGHASTGTMMLVSRGAARIPLPLLKSTTQGKQRGPEVTLQPAGRRRYSFMCCGSAAPVGNYNEEEVQAVEGNHAALRRSHPPDELH